MDSEGYRSAEVLLGWDFVEWLRGFQRAETIPWHWSSEEGFVGAGLLVAESATGDTEIVVVFQGKGRSEAAIRGLFQDIAPTLEYLLDGERPVALRVLWVTVGDKEGLWREPLRTTRREFRQILETERVHFSRQTRSEIDLRGLRIREAYLNIPNDTGQTSTLWLVPEGEGRAKRVELVVFDDAHKVRENKNKDNGGVVDSPRLEVGDQGGSDLQHSGGQANADVAMVSGEKTETQNRVLEV